MSLGDVYSNNIQKTSIGMSGIAGSMPATRERDPKSLELENNVFSQMQQAVVPPVNLEEKEPEPVINIQPVGLEQAMKELLNDDE
jgi:hypothetical protein|tara:strand:+ start:273 stop:527 length:255 start_codon:yes stop_codon:yes gene_type:complete